MVKSKQPPTKKRVKEEPGTQALGRGLKLLSCFTVDKPCWTISELSKHLGLPKSSVHRILCAHVNHGFIDKDEDSKRYYLGLKIFALSEAVAQRRLFAKLSRPHLYELASDTGEVCHIAIKQGHEFVYVVKLEGRYRFNIMTYIGMRMPLHVGGLGKMLLAHCDEVETNGFLSRNTLTRFTKNTLCDPDELKQVLTKISQVGYAIDGEEAEDGLTCVAVPIFGPKGKGVIAALSVSGPTGRITKENMPKYIDKTIQAGRNISAEFGYTGRYPVPADDKR